MDLSIVVSQVNFVAVFLAAVVGMAWGYLWYSDMLLGKAWREEAGVGDTDSQNGMGAMMVATFAMTFLAAFVLGIVLHNVAGVVDGLFDGAVLGGGFAFTTIATLYMYHQKSKALVWIDGLYYVTNFALMGLVFGLLS